MTLPEEIQNLIGELLVRIKTSSAHKLNREDRARLLRMLSGISISEEKTNDGTLSLIEVKPVVSWLGLITSYKVLPVWEEAKIFQSVEENIYRFLPGEMLELTRRVLAKEVDVEEANLKLENDFYFLPITMTKFSTENVYSVLEACRSTLSMTLWGMEPDILLDDYAAYACAAYAGIDENEPGLWNETELHMIYGQIESLMGENRNSEEFSQILETKNPLEILEGLGFFTEDWPEEMRNKFRAYKPFRCVPLKTLEFWEWWLTEAIPQAWDLAQEQVEK
ncbi:MAG TPA: hypothetical protein VH186_10210 [Chloroflexia bacterium]|nr:hypothetical protein [Chloroflexia bacterium]